MSDTFSKVEVITGVARRRRFSTDLKLAVVAETMQPGTNCLRRLQGQSVGPEHEFPGAEALIHAGSWRNCAFKSSKSTGLVMNSAAPYWVARLRRSSSP